MAVRRHQHRRHPAPVRRPHPPPTHRDDPLERSPGGIVELHVDDDLLAHLADSPVRAGRWAPVVSDIATQHADRDAHLVDVDAHPDARLPTAGQRRHTEIRDRTCTFAGVCRRPAHHCHQDHRFDHAGGGATVVVNLGPVCAMDHMAKHRAGWTSESTSGGAVWWHSPLGGHYSARREFLTTPMPGPVPRPDPFPDIPSRLVETPILVRPPPPPPQATATDTATPGPEKPPF